MDSKKSNYKLLAKEKSVFKYKNDSLLEKEILLTDENNAQIKFSSLLDIDLFTCHFTEEELRKIISKENSISYIYNLVIKYRGIYKSVLYEYPGLESVLLDKNGIIVKDFYENGKYMKINCVRRDNPFFQEKLAEFLSFLETAGDYENNIDLFFTEIYQDKNTSLELYAKNYYKIKDIETYTEDDGNKSELEEKLISEFSKYNVFRDYLVKMYKYRKKRGININNVYIPPKPVEFSRENKYMLSTPVFEEDEEDEEEFLTEEEITNPELNGFEEGVVWLNAPKARS